MTAKRTRLLRLAAVQLATIVGMLHVWLGIREWSYYRGDVFWPPDIRVVLWTLSGLVLLVGVSIVVLEEMTDRRVYAAGAVLSMTFILGYYSWHLGGHRSFFVAGDPQHQGVGPIEFLVSHAVAGPVEFFALLTEAALLLVLLLLCHPDPDA